MPSQRSGGPPQTGVAIGMMISLVAAVPLVIQGAGGSGYVTTALVISLAIVLPLLAFPVYVIALAESRLGGDGERLARWTLVGSLPGLLFLPYNLGLVASSGFLR